MNKFKMILAALAIVGMHIPAAAQVLGKDEVAPAGTVVYSLPSKKS